MAALASTVTPSEAPWRRSGSRSSRRSRSRRAACGSRQRASGSPGMRISPSGGHGPRALDVIDERRRSRRRNASLGHEDGRVEDDAQHVVGDAVDAEMAARRRR